jgi:glycosyltransferase involved in cell wall biosynthesis
MTRDAPISVIMPAHNGAKFYTSAIDSLLLQRWPELELIVIDDGSTDDLQAEVSRRGFSVLFLQQSQKGPAAARNLGLAHASCGLIAFLDIDDNWTAGHLDRLYAKLLQHPEAGIAQGLIQQVSPRDGGLSLVSGAYKMPHLGSCVMRKEVLDQLSGFDESMQIGEDYDFIFRCWENGIDKVDIEEVSLLYRRHPGNMTLGKNKEGYLAVVQRRMARLRSGRVDPSKQHPQPFGTYSGNIDNFWKEQSEIAVA